ncbi:hypothetical protein QOT17_009988 [Balamuthia mandrillaris]
MSYSMQAIKASCDNCCSSSLYLPYCFFGTSEEHTLCTEQEIFDVFGHHTKREFKHGSYLVMALDIMVKYLTNTGKTQLRLKYCVYNCHDVLQWPESYTFSDIHHL